MAGFCQWQNIFKLSILSDILANQTVLTGGNYITEWAGANITEWTIKGDIENESDNLFNPHTNLHHIQAIYNCIALGITLLMCVKKTFMWFVFKEHQ